MLAGLSPQHLLTDTVQGNNCMYFQITSMKQNEGQGLIGETCILLQVTAGTSCKQLLRLHTLATRKLSSELFSPELRCLPVLIRISLHPFFTFNLRHLN